MKNTLFIVAFASCLLCGCTQKVQVKDDISTIQMQSDKNGTNRMQPYKVDTYVMVNGKKYDYYIKREACDSLGVVKSEVGGSYVNNQIELKVSCEGNVIFHKTFTKNSFASYADPKYLDESVLEGIVFDRVEGDNIIFAGSIGDPQIDMYDPFSLKLSTSGSLTIEKVTGMDGFDEDLERIPETQRPR